MGRAITIKLAFSREADRKADQAGQYISPQDINTSIPLINNRGNCLRVCQAPMAFTPGFAARTFSAEGAL